jgi:hypothetical protein
MNLATEKIEWTANATESPAFEIENERIFAGLNHSGICIINTNDGSIVHQLQLSERFSDDHVYHIGLTHKYLIAKSARKLCVFDKNTLQLIHTSKCTGEYGLSVNDKFIVYGTHVCTYLLDHDSLEMIGMNRTQDQHTLQLVDEELLSNENCEILFWDIRKFSQKRRIKLNDLVDLFVVRFVYDKTKLVVDWTYNTEDLWLSQIQKVDPSTGEILHTYQVQHDNSCFAMDPTKMVVGSNDVENTGVSLLNFTGLQHK